MFRGIAQIIDKMDMLVKLEDYMLLLWDLWNNTNDATNLATTEIVIHNSIFESHIQQPHPALINTSNRSLETRFIKTIIQQKS